MFANTSVPKPAPRAGQVSPIVARLNPSRQRGRESVPAARPGEWRQRILGRSGRVQAKVGNIADENQKRNDGEQRRGEDTATLLRERREAARLPRGMVSCVSELGATSDAPASSDDRQPPLTPCQALRSWR